MTITREINGIKIEIRLTDSEVYDAYLEKQNYFDLCDMEDAFNGMDDSELEDYYGLTREQLNERIPELAAEMRRCINNYDMDWISARDAVIAEMM